jgi:hypothetical protein
MTTKLSIANGALRILKEGSITQNELDNDRREPARLFNSVWDDGGLDACLRSGEWRFARRTAMLESSPSVEPDFGLRYAFEKPDDFVRTCGQYADEMLRNPLSDREIREETGFWFCSRDPIYVTYVSNDAAYGLDYSKWPQDFLKFVCAHFASEIAGPLTSEGAEALKLRRHYLTAALSTDGQSDPTRTPPIGSWVRARATGYRRDGQPR